MDPHALIDTTYSAPLPAPLWFIQFFKVLGFTLHMILMNLWYAGVPLAVCVLLWGGSHARRWAGRLMLQMPVMIAFGVNFGIVPLLFIQVAYGKFFYPATILMAWPWISVFVLLTIAYYGVYLFAHGWKKHGERMPGRYLAIGWGSAVIFVIIGFIFANAMTLMADVNAWPELFQKHSLHGAALGTALSTAEASLWPRWLMLFGLALTTLSVWTVFDATWLAAGEGVEYHRWCADFAWKVHGIGLLVFAGMGAWYVFGTWPEAVRAKMLHGPLLVHTLLTGALPGLVWILLAIGRSRASGEPLGVGRGWAAAVAAAQLAVLGINAISRQMVQNIEIAPFAQSLRTETIIQWSPMLMFLIVFVLGAAIVVWMVFQIVRVERSNG